MSLNQRVYIESSRSVRAMNRRKMKRKEIQANGAGQWTGDDWLNPLAPTRWLTAAVFTSVGLSCPLLVSEVTRHMHVHTGIRAGKAPLQ